MQKSVIAVIAVVFTALVVLASTATAASAKGGRGIIKTGSCSASSHWKLKAKADDGRIETEFEVDQNRVGKRWNVKLVRNGSVAFNGIRKTLAPSGSFEVRRLLAASAGTTRIVATARSLSTGETCRAALSL